MVKKIIIVLMLLTTLFHGVVYSTVVDGSQGTPVIVMAYDSSNGELGEETDFFEILNLEVKDVQNEVINTSILKYGGMNLVFFEEAGIYSIAVEHEGFIAKQLQFELDHPLTQHVFVVGMSPEGDVNNKGTGHLMVKAVDYYDEEKAPVVDAVIEVYSFENLDIPLIVGNQELLTELPVGGYRIVVSHEDFTTRTYDMSVAENVYSITGVPLVADLA